MESTLKQKESREVKKRAIVINIAAATTAGEHHQQRLSSVVTGAKVEKLHLHVHEMNEPRY